MKRADAAEAEVAVLTARLKAAKEVTGIFEADWKQELARNEVLTARLTEAEREIERLGGDVPSPVVPS